MKCPKCQHHDTSWVGYSARALRRLRPAKDVVVCNRCGHTWRYARTGRETTTRVFVTDYDLEER